MKGNYMKRKFALVLAITLCLAASVTACGKSRERKEVNNSSGSQTAESGYTFAVSGVNIGIGEDFAQYKDSLGEASMSESTSCANAGMDRRFSYKGYIVMTNCEAGSDVDYVTHIELKDDTVSTPEGIAIGDDASKVAEKYGEATESDDKKMIYVKGGMRLIFLLTDGKVSSIQYEANE